MATYLLDKSFRAELQRHLEDTGIEVKEMLFTCKVGTEPEAIITDVHIFGRQCISIDNKGVGNLLIKDKKTVAIKKVSCSGIYLQRK